MTAQQLVIAAGTPYDVLVDALWQLLESSAEFCALVRPANRIKFAASGPRSPIKSEVSTEDLPEVRIVVTGSTPNAHLASNSVSDLVRLEIQCSSGDQRLPVMHHPLKWVVFKAMCSAQEVLQRATWSGKSFVRRVETASVTEGVSQTDLNRGIIGWSAVWACEVLCEFARSEIVAT